MKHGYARPLLVVCAFAVIGVATLLISHAATTSPAITNANGKCLDDKGGAVVNGNTVWLYGCNGTPAQQWTVMSDGTIRDQGYCLDVKGSSTVRGTLVQLYVCNGTVAQKWTVRSDQSIINPHSGLCLDNKYSKTANGNPIWTWICNCTGAQK
jgi:hypothetical protein